MQQQEQQQGEGSVLSTKNKKPRTGDKGRQQRTQQLPTPEDFANINAHGENDAAAAAHGNGGGGGMLSQGWAPPGLGVCQLWAQQASSLKKKHKTGEIGPLLHHICCSY